MSLAFGESPAGATRLFSLGADGRLAEFQLPPGGYYPTAASTAGGLRLAALHDVAAPGGGRPSALCFAPPMPYWARASTETLLLIAGARVRRLCHCCLSACLPPAGDSSALSATHSN